MAVMLHSAGMPAPAGLQRDGQAEHQESSGHRQPTLRRHAKETR